MKSAKQKYQDPFVGYFASVALALLGSGWMAGLIVAPISAHMSEQITQGLTVSIAAGLFLAVAFSNLIGTIIRRASLRAAFIRFVLGFVLGWFIQVSVFTPMAGHGMSNFLFLLVAGAAVPVVYLAQHLRVFLNSHGFAAGDTFLQMVLRAFGLSDRAIFVSLMAVSSILFWLFAKNTNELLLGLAAVLAILVTSVSLRKGKVNFEDDPEEAEFQAWLDLEPEEEPGPTDQAISRFKHVVQVLLPGAVMFGGMIRLAVEFLLYVFPDIHANFAAPMQTAQTIGIIAASGLAVIFFGMLTALGFGLASLQILGRIRNWTPAHLRDKCFYLVRLMYFRPIRRD